MQKVKALGLCRQDPTTRRLVVNDAQVMRTSERIELVERATEELVAYTRSLRVPLGQIDLVLRRHIDPV